MSGQNAGAAIVGGWPYSPNPALSGSRKVFAAIQGVQTALARQGLGKSHYNEHQRFNFRSVDDLYGPFTEALLANKLLMLPRVKDVRTEALTTPGDRPKLAYRTIVTVDYEFVSVEDGSTFTATYAGEGIDNGDKATSKALTMAFKYLLIHGLQIPLEGIEDPDGSAPLQTPPSAASTPARAEKPAPASNPKPAATGGGSSTRTLDELIDAITGAIGEEETNAAATWAWDEAIRAGHVDWHQAIIKARTEKLEAMKTTEIGKTRKKQGLFDDLDEPLPPAGK